MILINNKYPLLEIYRESRFLNLIFIFFKLNREKSWNFVRFFTIL